MLNNALKHPFVLGIRNFYHFERLEFLGDRVLGLIMADILYEKYANKPEGFLAKKHSFLVSREICHEIGEKLGLYDFIKFRKSDYKSTNTSIIANTLESILGAMYLDSDVIACKKFVKKFWSQYFMQTLRKDFKSSLQEWAQKKGLGTPTYTIFEKKGPEHSPVFKIKVDLPKKGYAYGVGTSRKQAEQKAASDFLKKQKIK